MEPIKNTTTKNNETLLIEVSNFAEYTQSRKTFLGLANEQFAAKVGVSKGEISKIINKNKSSVSLNSFYKIAVNTGDTIEHARDSVYPHRSFELKDVSSEKKKNKTRTSFGKYMQENFEKEDLNIADDEYSFEKILAKTGIEEQRLKDIYFNTGAPEPYEFLLIEKAVGKQPGEMMKDYIEKHTAKTEKK